MAKKIRTYDSTLGQWVGIEADSISDNTGLNIKPTDIGNVSNLSTNNKNIVDAVNENLNSLKNIEYDLTKDGIVSGQDISTKLQNAINAGYKVINLKDYASFKINSVVNLPNYPIVLKGNATTISTDMVDGTYNVLFDKGSNSNAGIVFDKVYFASRNHRTTNAINQNNFMFGNIYAINNPSSLFPALDIANFAGQGLSTASAPIGFTLHHYTDGHMIQIDNVGTGNCIVTTKNAWNKLRRMDKDSTFVGSGDFYRALQSSTDGNTETVTEIFKLDKFGDFQFNKNLVDFVNNKAVDGGFWAWRIRNVNKMSNVFTLQNGTDAILSVTYDSVSNINNLTLSPNTNENDINASKITVFKNTAFDDGFWGFLFKNAGAKDHLMAVVQNGKTMIDTRLDKVDIQAFRLINLATLPTPVAGAKCFHNGVFKRCVDGVNWVAE